MSLPPLPPSTPGERCQLGMQAVTQYWCSRFYCSHATPLLCPQMTRLCPQMTRWTPVDTRFPQIHDIHQVPVDSSSLVFITILNNLLPSVIITKQASGGGLRLTRANHQLSLEPGFTRTPISMRRLLQDTHERLH